jgi:hypothetical protein
MCTILRLVVSVTDGLVFSLVSSELDATSLASIRIDLLRPDLVNTLELFKKTLDVKLGDLKSELIQEKHSLKKKHSLPKTEHRLS